MSENLLNKVESLDKLTNKNEISLYKFSPPCEYKRYEAVKSVDIIDECRTIRENIEDLAYPQANVAYCYIETRNKY